MLTHITAAQRRRTGVAGQVFKDVIRKEMRQALTETVDAAARKALVRGAWQMRKELAEKIAAQLAEEWAGEGHRRRPPTRWWTRSARRQSSKILADTVADTFGKELVEVLRAEGRAGRDLHGRPGPHGADASR